MQTLDRYILKQFLTNFVILLAVLMGLFIVVDLIVDLDEFLQAGKEHADRDGFGIPIVATLYTVVDYYVPVVLLIYVFFSGLIVVGAMGFTVTALQRQRELIAMLAGGISLYRVALPILLGGALLSAVTLPVQEFVLPNLAGKLMRSKADLKREGVKERPLLYIADAEGRLWSAAGFDSGKGLLRGVQVVERDADGLLARKVMASEAVWDEATSSWYLTQGVALRPDATRPSGGGEADGLVPVDAIETTLSPMALLAQQTSVLPAVLSLRQLRALGQNPALDASQRGTHTRTVWGRFSLLVLNVLLLVMALPYFLRRVPGDVLKASVMAAGLCLGAWAGGVMTLQASPEQLPPVVSAWLPVVLYLPVAAWMLTRIRT